jgi:hypothetical protein
MLALGLGGVLRRLDLLFHGLKAELCSLTGTARVDVNGTVVSALSFGAEHRWSANAYNDSGISGSRSWVSDHQNGPTETELARRPQMNYHPSLSTPFYGSSQVHSGNLWRTAEASGADSQGVAGVDRNVRIRGAFLDESH